MLDIRRITSEDTYQIRQKVLRPNQNLEECMYANDNHPNSFHLGAFKHDNLNSVASFYQEDHPSLDGGLQYRLRGMATVAEFRNLTQAALYCWKQSGSCWKKALRRGGVTQELP